jgi:hypothetical protein
VLLNLPAGTPGELQVVVETCETDGTSIPNCTIGGTKRKLARVQATLDVNLAFLPMVGWTNVPITADAISEAASIDLVLVIDNSTSMAYDVSCSNNKDDDGDGNVDDCDPSQYWWPPNQPGEPLPQNPEPCTNYGSAGNPPDPGAGDQCLDGGTPIDLPDDYYRYPSVCNFYGNCQPFEKVRAAAATLVSSMFYQYDKISLITFNKFAGQINDPLFRGTIDELPLHIPDLQLTINTADANTALANMTVYPNMQLLADPACPDWVALGDPRGCMRTNHAAGLMLAGIELESARARDEAVKVVVLLSDGLANAAYVPESGFGVPDFINDPTVWYCPTEYWRCPDGLRCEDDLSRPFCTDGNPAVGYDGVWPPGSPDPVNDPDDAARKFADWLGCLPSAEGGDCSYGGGIGAVIFTIGLGKGVDQYGPNAPSPVVGEELLRYIARVGFNGDPQFTPDSPCWGVASGTSCGNYYYSPDADQLGPIFEEIADRIFTRLTH